MNRPPLTHCQRETNMYLVKEDHKGEGFLSINLVSLGEPTSN